VYCHTLFDLCVSICSESWVKVRFYAASAASSSGAGSSTCESQYSTPTMWCGCRQCGQKTFAKSNWLTVAWSISMPVETSSPVAGQMKTSVPIPSSMTRPRAKIKTGSGLPCKTVVVQCNNTAAAERRTPVSEPEDAHQSRRCSCFLAEHLRSS
jgi:hypothetical protein